MARAKLLLIPFIAAVLAVLTVAGIVNTRTAPPERGPITNEKVQEGVDALTGHGENAQQPQ